MNENVTCPKCGECKPEKVSFTWWGGLIGPAMFNHTKCRGCGTTYNGKTGKSNNTAIAIYTVVVLAIVIVIMIAVNSK